MRSPLYIFRILKEKFWSKRRNKLNDRKKQNLKNKDFSLISINCVGCCVLNDLGVRFNSPFVNLYLEAKDFLKYLSNPDYYNQQKITFVDWDTYPIGFLDDVKVYFVHYKSEDEVVAAWTRRTQRINKEKLFVLFSDREGCTYEDLKFFDALPYKNKIVFTHVPYPDIKSAFYIKGFENENCVGNLIEWKPREFGKRYYDDFDFVSWFNEESNFTNNKG